MTNPADHTQLYAALGRVPSGLYILTARQGESETGMLVSWVQQCSFEPPQLTVALKQGREVTAWLAQGAGFTLNVLDEDQTDILAHFGRGFGPGEPAFQEIAIDRPGGACPVLCEALAYLNCQVTAHYPAGDHDLVIGLVLDGRVQGDGRPMVHVRRTGKHY